MKFRERSVILFKRISFKVKETIREIGNKTSIPKSSVHRQKRSQKKRIEATGHALFETDSGLDFLHRLFVATLLIFGLQGSVGSETISLFFKFIKVNAYIGVSPSNIRKIKEKMREGLNIFSAEQMPLILKLCEQKELHLGGDETFFDTEQFLVLMELTSGFLFTEALVKDRKVSTWSKCSSSVLNFFKKICSFSSDGGQALIAVGKSLLCKNSMDLFHFLQDMNKLFATKFHSKRRSLIRQRDEIQKNNDTNKEENKASLEKIYSNIALQDNGQSQYRQSLFTVSTQVHPFQNISRNKNSAELQEQLNKQVKLLNSIASTCGISDKKKLLNRLSNRVEPLARLNDLWHNWVDTSVLCKTEDSIIIDWAKHTLLPYFYWKGQLKKSKRKKTQRLYYQNIVEQSERKLLEHPLTHKHLNDDWEDWACEMAKKYQRGTSAIEGRNARLSHHYFSTRGVRASHVKPLTVLHNFLIKRDDGTTAAQRLCCIQHPDVFEWMLAYMKNLPFSRRPRKKINTFIGESFAV